MEPAAGWFRVELAGGVETCGLTLGLLRLAVAALFASGVFVTFVAIARTPLVELIAGRGYLYTALAAHVIFALDIWMLSFTAVLWVLGAARVGAALSARLGRPGLILASLGSVLLAAVPLAGLGEPVLVDYVPIVVHPVFILGLGSFFAGIALLAVGFLASLRRLGGAPSLEAQALGCGAVGYLVALPMFPLAALRWGASDYGMLVWGAGHLFQLVNAANLIAVWLMMVPTTGRRSKRLVSLSLGGFVLSICVVVLVHVSVIQWDRIAPLFWAGIGTPVGVSWLAVVGTLLRQRRQDRLGPREASFLLFSLVLLGIGGLIALNGLGSDTRVTAHYHATVGAATIVFMGLTYRLLPQLGREVSWKRVSRLQPYLYGIGLLLLVAGLYLAGEAGTARKIFQAITTTPSLLPAFALFALGAVTTVAGGVVFVCGTGASLVGTSAPVAVVSPGRVMQRAREERGAVAI